LRQAERYAIWLHLETQALSALALIGLGLNFLVSGFYVYSDRYYRFFVDVRWTMLLQLLGLAGALAVYGLATVLQGSGRHPALSDLTKRLGQLSDGLFLWP